MALSDADVQKQVSYKQSRIITGYPNIDKNFR